MVNQYKFFRTLRRRRWFVALYYLFALALAAMMLWRSRQPPWLMILQISNLVLIIGGLTANGPVKAFSRPLIPLEQGDPIWKSPSPNHLSKHLWSPLDERERIERDHAHYTAYRFLRWGISAAALAYWLGLYWAPVWLAKNSAALLWLLVVFVLSLPQAVILWTETPDPEDISSPQPEVSRQSTR